MKGALVPGAGGEVCFRRGGSRQSARTRPAGDRGAREDRGVDCRRHGLREERRSFGGRRAAILRAARQADPTRTAYRKLDRDNPKTTHGRAGSNPVALPVLPSLPSSTTYSTTLPRIVVTQ